MADEKSGSQEKTEEPTPRRREEARREGRVARSQELLAASLLIAGVVVLAGAGGDSLVAFVRRTLAGATGSLASGELTALGAVSLVRHTTIELLVALSAMFACVLVVVPGVGLVQTRGVVSMKPIVPDWSRLSPVQGFKRMTGMDGLFSVLKSLAKLVVIAFVAASAIARSWPELSSLAALGPAETAAVLRGAMARVALWGGLAFLLLAAVDWAFQWFRMRKSLRMSRDEVVRELRDSEGDPLIKARMQSIARARARSRMLQKVPTADVVVVNPTQIAVALRYDVEVSSAPVVVAMGRRKLAERIKALARKHGVPIVENKPVARALIASSKVGKPIPPALYAAIAEILAFVYRQRGAFTLRRSGGEGRIA